MNQKNNSTIDKEIERIELKITQEKEFIKKLELLKVKDHYESENNELFILDNSIKSGKLRVINSWKAEGIAVCDEIYSLGHYKVYNNCALLYSISKINTYDYTARQWLQKTEGFINKECPDYFNFFNRNNATLRRALSNFSNTQLYKNNSSQIPAWLQDYFILM